LKNQRLRFRFSLGVEAASLSNREIVAAIEHAAVTSGLTVVYSEGKRPAPQISIAAPLSLGATSDCELVDIFLCDRVPPPDALARLSGGLPDGLRALSAEDVGISSPSLQSLLRWAEYEVEVPRAWLAAADAQSAIDHLLLAGSLPAEYRREHKVRSYDLRPLVLSLRLEREEDKCFIIAMRLRAEQDKTARVDQVVLALGLPAAQRIHRRCLHLDDTSPALLTYRRLGQVDER
jgi:radical SAM-linked protein